MNKNQINLLYCGNEKVFDGLLISLLSMTKYTKIPIHVYVITMDLQELKEDYKPLNQNQIEYLEKMIREANPQSTVKLFDITKMFLEETKDSPNLKNNYTPYTLARLFADKIPSIPEKILYLDTDLNKKEEYNHATIITKIENGDIFYAGHTSNRYDKSLTESILEGSVQYCFVIHIKNYAV